jgi:hypothetical protein
MILDRIKGLRLYNVSTKIVNFCIGLCRSVFIL